jgi:hypothetical protein
MPKHLVNMSLTPEKKPPDPQWKITVPSYLKAVFERERVMLSLDVHAVAYTTFLGNIDVNMSEQARYEMSYVLAWLYATFPDTLEMLYPYAVNESNRTLGTGEIKPRLTYSGENMTPNLFMKLEEDEYEDDEELEERLGKCAKMTKAAEKACTSLDPDKNLVSAYLRHGMEADFKFFLRRSFVNEEFTDNAQAIAISVYHAAQDPNFSIKEHTKVPLSVRESIEKNLLIYVTEVQGLTPNVKENKLPEDVSQKAMMLATDVNYQEIVNNPEKYRKKLGQTSVTLLKINTALKVLAKMPYKEWDDFFMRLSTADLAPVLHIPHMKQMVNQPVQLIILQDNTGNMYATKLVTEDAILLWEQFKKTFMNEQMDRQATRVPLNSTNLFGVKDENVPL